ncbi:MAG TPA: DNA polymerase IV, partial [Verrucomicrobiae bacterium]|nr:DNA polymerase IV [Verrucomicrobiae bacterium]
KTRCRGLVCSIGVASTKSAAKIASDYKKPDGLTIIPPQKLIQFLEPLEVNKISGIGSKTNQILKEMGIKTIDQLAKCDVQVLIDKFGKKIGLWMWNVSNGRDNDPVLPRDDNISISVEKTILKSLENKNVILEFLITEITDDLYTKIQTKGYEFKTVGIKLVRSDFGLETREITFSSYQNTKESIINVLGSLLGKFQFDLLNESDNSINNKSGIPIRKLGIKVSNLSKINKKIKSNQKTLLDYMQ